MTALAAGLIEGGSAGFTSPFVIAALTLAAVALAAFFTLEARASEPMLPLPLFRRDRAANSPRSTARERPGKRSVAV